MPAQQCRFGLLALFMITMITVSCASNLRPTHGDINMIQTQTDIHWGARKSSKKETDKVDIKSADSDKSDDNDDDDDDDDDDASRATSVRFQAEDKAATDVDAESEEELASAKADHKEAESELEAFNDDAAFESKIDAEVKLMTNETESPTLSSFLGDLRTELRKYSEPTYPAYLEKKVAEKEKKIAELEAELGKKKKSSGKAEPVAVAAPLKAAPAKADKEDKDSEEKETSDDKTEKKPEKAESKAAHSPAGLAQKASAVWALSFFANVVLLAVVFAMANTKNTDVRGSTWFLIDQVIAIFLAVMYFQAFNSFMDFGSFGTGNEVVAGLCHAVIMLALVLIAAYKFRNDGITLAILCGAGAHIVSFSSIDAAADTQNKVWVNYSYSSAMMVFGIAVLGLGLFIIGYLVYTAKKRANVLGADDFMDKTDDLENDFGSMAFSVVFTMFVRYMLTGHHPVDDDTDFDHTAEQRMYMLIYACFALLVSAFATPFFAKKAVEAANANDYGKKRIWTFLTTVVTMNVAWAFLYWGEWEFFEALYPGEAVKGRVMFAISASVVGALGIFGITKMKSMKVGQGQTAKSADKVALTALSLLVAWSWELCFDAAVEDMVKGSAHPVTWKVTSTLCLFAIVLPVYGLYVKPAVKINGGEG